MLSINNGDGVTFASMEARHCAKQSLPMIRHIVFFTAKSPEHVDAICEGLSLLAEIPLSLRYEVSRNSRVDLYGNEIDVVVYGEFADQAALNAYNAHPNYDEATLRV